VLIIEGVVAVAAAVVARAAEEAKSKVSFEPEA
jgi:hypothetical protein